MVDAIHSRKQNDTAQMSGVEALSIRREALHAAATARLRDMIVQGVLHPGTRLNERLLCERLSISRTPLREAFKVLATEGLVELLPNRGAVVTRMNIEDIECTFEVMSALEGFSGELACQRITDLEIQQVKALHFEMLACHARRDLPGYYRLNHDIHNAINLAARNPVLTQTYLQINARLQALRFRSNFEPDKWDIAVREHGEMLDALSARDGIRLRDVLRQHVVNKCRVVVDQLRAEADRAHG
jgi:DNA-binding GntR family transcriptional regulator